MAVSLYTDERNAQQALISLERALQLDPDNAEAHLLSAHIYATSGLYGQAEPHLRRAVDLFAREAPADPEKQVKLDEARNALGAVLINLDRAQEAVPILEQVATEVHYPTPHLALGNLGQAYIALHRYPDAIAVLERAVASRPDFCLGNYRLGDAYLRAEDYPHALGALDRALNSQASGCNRIQEAWRDRGEVHARLHQPDAAREDFAHCRDLDAQSTVGQDCAAQLRTSVAP